MKQSLKIWITVLMVAGTIITSCSSEIETANLQNPPTSYYLNPNAKALLQMVQLTIHLQV